MNRIFPPRFLNADTWFRPLIGVLALLLIVKLTLGVMLLGTHSPAITLLPAEAQAQDETAPATPAISDNASAGPEAQTLGDDYSWKYELVRALRERDTVLAQREALLRDEERRVREIKQEIEVRIEKLQQLQNEIAALINQQQTAENEKMKKLAKVFEETPPEQAGPLLSRLDVDIAAQLLLKMNGRKAGRIWGYVDPGQAVKISKELARLQPDNTLAVGQ